MLLLAGFGYFLYGALQNLKSRVYKVPCYDQWRCNAESRMACCDHCEAASEGFHHDLMRLVVTRFFRFWVLYDLCSDHESLSSHIADDIVFFLHLLQPFDHIVALFCRVFHQVLVSDRIDDLERSGARHRISPERVRMGPSVPVHEIRVRNRRANRHTRRQRLRRAENIGFHAPVFNPEPAPSPSHPGLHLIVDHQDSILVQQFSEPLEIFRRRYNIAALSLDRFDEECGDIFRWKILVKDLFLDEIDAVHVTLGIGHFERASVAVGEGNVGVAWNHWEEVSTLDGLACCEAQCAQGSSVEGSYEADEAVLARMPLGKLHSRLNCLRAAVAQEHFLLEAPRRYLDQFLR